MRALSVEEIGVVSGGSYFGGGGGPYGPVVLSGQPEHTQVVVVTAQRMTSDQEQLYDHWQSYAQKEEDWERLALSSGVEFNGDMSYPNWFNAARANTMLSIGSAYATTISGYYGMWADFFANQFELSRDGAN